MPARAGRRARNSQRSTGRNNRMTRKNAYSHAEILGSQQEPLFGAGSAQLPAGNMLMVDRVIEVNDDGGGYGKGAMVAELDIRPDLWFFACHFPGDPVMPGCLGLDALWQLLGFYLAWSGKKGKGRALGVKEVRFRGEILPTSKVVRYTLDIKRMVSGKLILGAADGTVAVDGEQVYTAKELRVGLFAHQASSGP